MKGKLLFVIETILGIIITILFIALIIFGTGNGIIYSFNLNMVWTYFKSLISSCIFWCVKMIIV